ncbi:hypothetical protein P344_05135 [Spiroplasma mirum ATCC 29335]|uniref:Probable cytosol aminopeptidase n=1 Tax=Spiroplasma mirum ATCC 29335 TaxID=838561 RepID=W0GM40_9MOLU|nr:MULTISPECIES: hypothetical protein [Spiroplasma]AHF61247.1 N-terminal truncated leucyl aminopeptidase [Spiroplasma mirum ATCC 29335]AHI58349.1 hypothetical protein P344_05135 [Spiroplasma mirum ATCC 29335]
MADAITYAIQKLQATKIITIATLTRAMIKDLEKYVTGAMATSNELFDRFHQATCQACETFWRMPVSRENYQAMSNTQYSDLVNHSYDKYNPTGNSMAFLDNFTESLSFLHIDITGTAYIDDCGKGTMVKSIIEYYLLEG